MKGTNSSTFAGWRAEYMSEGASYSAQKEGSGSNANLTKSENHQGYSNQNFGTRSLHTEACGHWWH